MPPTNGLAAIHPEVLRAEVQMFSFRTRFGYVESCQFSTRWCFESFRLHFAVNMPALVRVRQIPHDDEPSSSDYVFGCLFIDISRGAYSLTTVRDVDPVEIAAFLGNMGGFWGKDKVSQLRKASQGFGQWFRYRCRLGRLATVCGDSVVREAAELICVIGLLSRLSYHNNLVDKWGHL